MPRTVSRNFPRAEMRRISGRYSDCEGAVLQLRRNGFLTDAQAKRLHGRIEKAWHRENIAAMRKARNAPR